MLYVPVMRSKQGEIGALSVASDRVKRKIQPLIDLTPRSDASSDDPKRTVSEHIERLANRLVEAWRIDQQPLFIDVATLAAVDDVDAPEALSLVAERCIWQNQRVAPVTAPERSEAYQAQVRHVVEQHDAGACLRLGESSFERPRGLSSRIDRFLLASNLDPAQVHLVVDLRGARPVLVEMLLALLPRVDDWREFTLAAGSFPSSLQGVDQQRFPRHELALWRRYTDDLDDGQELELRRPSFGDYGPVFAGTDEILDVMYKPAPNLRYTTPHSWIVLRGRGGAAVPGNAQMYDLCAHMVAIYRTEFQGADFSWGDRWIHDRAHREPPEPGEGERPGPGNASTWIKVAFSHHLAATVDQLATPPAP